MTVASFPEMRLEDLARAVAESLSHAQFTTIFGSLALQAPSEGPRWHRILVALLERQRRDGCGNNVGAFVERVLDPANFLGRAREFEDLRSSVNMLLAFHGLEVGTDGKLKKTSVVTTLSQAEDRAGRLRSELRRRNVHEDVLRFCRPELVDKNYFHAVLEATKSVAEKLRSKTGLTCDGSELAQKALGGKQPLLAINSLVSDTERSEQSGFANLLVGTFGMFRNPTAHSPKVTWAISEEEALDLLSLVSLLHRRLDRAVRTGFAVPVRSPEKMGENNEIPWPSADDVAFASGPGFRNADVSWLRRVVDDEALADGFKRMGDYAVAALEQGIETSHERVFLPIAYAYRHSIELALKSLLRRAEQLELADDVAAVLGGHDLGTLWARVRQALEKFFAGDDPAPLLAAERIVLEFTRLDPSGQSFRYARDKKNRSQLESAPSHVDLIELKRVMAGLSNFLDGCASSFGVAIDNLNEMRHYYEAGEREP